MGGKKGNSHDGAALSGGLDVSVDEVGPLAGRLGLRNMGNTCFMNAGLQCIAHLEPLAQYFLRRGFERDSSLQLSQANSSSSGGAKPGSKGELTHSFTLLLREMWQCGVNKAGQKCKDILPRNFYNTFKQLQPFLFEDDQQQDVQEFIGFCLEGLNEDLNRVAQLPSNPTDAQMKEDERLGNEEGDDFAAALSWYRHLEREKSFLIDLLQGQLRSSVTCQQCGYMSRKFEPFMHLSIPVEKSMNCLTDGICKYLEEEELSGDEQWHCEKCNAKVDAKKKIDLWFLPPVLILHLKRFDASLTKIDKRLHMNVYGFDLSKCCSKPQKDGAIYDVSCVANHQGAYGSGHYTAVCRVGPPSSGTWHMYDDERVSDIKDSRSVATKQAYVVFLVRQGRDDLVATGSKKRAEALAKPKTQALLRQRMLPRCQSVTNPDDWPHALGPAVKAREAAVHVRLEPRLATSETADAEKSCNSKGEEDAESHPAIGSSAVGPEKPFQIGQRVHRHDGDGHWGEGFVTSLDPLLVTANGKDPDVPGREWFAVRHIPEMPEQEGRVLVSESVMPSTKGHQHTPVLEDDSLASGKCPPAGLSASFRNVFTPSRRSRSVSDDANQSLQVPKRQRSILDFCRSAKVDVQQSAPKQQRSLLDFFRST